MVDPHGQCFHQVHQAGAADPSIPGHRMEGPLEVLQPALEAPARPGPLTGLPMVLSTPPAKLDPLGPPLRDLEPDPTDRRCDRWPLDRCLLDALIEHWRASLIAVFDVARELEMSTPKTEIQRKRKREKVEKSLEGLKWYEKKPTIVEDEAGLGIPDSEALRRGEKVRILHHQPRDFTVEARFSEKEYQVEEQEDKLFVIDDERDWDTLTDHVHPGEELFA